MYPAIVFLPLAGAVIAGFFGRTLGDKTSGFLTSLFLVAAAGLSWIAFYHVGFLGEEARVPLLPFIGVGDLQTSWSLRIDTLTAVMLVVVTTVSSLVHIYSIGYMSEDDRQPLFFAELSLFTFAMLSLVTADNLVQLFFGWEGVGLASYLLIGFWYHRPSANQAAIKAFIVNRVGDFGFALGIFAIYYIFRDVNFDTIFAAAREKQSVMMPVFGYQVDALTVICLLLFMGAMGKSAQFLLHTWLPDAMEGPTPVSALIHAATMVTAGVFMVARLSPSVRAFSGGADGCHRDWGDHRVLRGYCRRGPERHQARDRLFDLLAAWLHVRRVRPWRLCRRHLPSFHARLLQSAAFPRVRLGDPRPPR